MRKIAFGILVGLPVPVMALPGMPRGHSMQQAVTQDVIEVKRGHGHGWGRGHGRHHRAYGWSRGNKVGWRGRHCPPGQWKKGRC
jgi:hypothetical protein